MTTIPQGYKSTELGIIPETWSVKELGQILSIHHGKSQKDVEADDGEYPIMATGGLIGRSRSYLYNKPSVLIGRKGTIDKPQFIDTPFWTVDTLFYTSIRPDYDPFFTYSACCCIDWESYNEGTCVPSLISSTIEKIKLPIPSDITEQRAIAAALADVDALIEAKRALLEKKRAIKQGTMQELLTGNRRLPGFPVTPMKHTEIGDLPEDWEVKELGSLACMKSGQSITGASIEGNGDYPCYGGNGLRGYTKTYTHEGTFPLIGRQGALCGNVTLARNRFYASEHAVVVTPYQGVDAEWISWILIHMNLNSISEASAQGGLAVSKILKLKAPFPQREEQCAIAAILSDMDAEIESLEQELVKLCDLKQGMMQNLLTGRIRLV